MPGTSMNTPPAAGSRPWLRNYPPGVDWHATPAKSPVHLSAR